MSGFYYNENNFEHLYNDVSILLSNTILESSMSEIWLKEYFMNDKYNTIKAIERYLVDLILNTDNVSLLEHMNFDNLSNENIVIENVDFKDVMSNVNNFENNCNVIDIVNSLLLTESIEYLQEKLNLKDRVRNFKIEHEGIKKLLTVTESLKRIVKIKTPGSEELNCIKEEIDKILYKNKSFSYDGKKYRAGLLKGVLAHKADKMTCDDIRSMFVELDELLSSNPDYMIKYVLDELIYINNIILEKEKSIAPITESSQESLYFEKVSEFNNLVESLFFEEDEMDLNDFIKLQLITEALINYEDTMEASSRIITKGAGKITKAIGNTSARSNGMSKSSSKMGQIARDTRVAGGRVADAITQKVNDILGSQKEERRKRIITGSVSVKLLQLLKRAIGIVCTKKVLGKVFTGAKIGSHAFGPLISTILTIVLALGKFALDKRADERERKRVVTELETELRIVREKIEDAKGDNARKEKYELMRIEASLDKEITRIKYGLRPE